MGSARLLGTAIGTAALLLVAVTFWTAREVIPFRDRPKKSTLEKYFSSSLPNRVVARALLLLPGSDTFNEDVSYWAVQTDAVSDNTWNRWILERLISRLPIPTRRSRIAEYRLTPTSAFSPACLEILDAYPAADDDPYPDLPAVFDLTQRIPDTHHHLEAWVENHIVKRNDVDLFQLLLPELVASDFVDWPSLVQSFWPNVWLGEAASALEPKSQSAARLLDLMERSAEAQDSDPAKILVTLGPFLSLDSTRDRALAVFSKILPRLEGPDGSEPSPPYDPDDPFPSHEEFGSEQPLSLLFSDDSSANTAAIAYSLVEFAKERRPAYAASAFHYLAHADIKLAEKALVDLIGPRDSTLRKSAIVLLARHDSQIVSRWIDDAFRGSAPRRTYFSSRLEYAFGSAATDLYELVSGHPYLGQPKTWPPLRSSRQATSSEWSDFIARYPWHPGADDATYRLISLAFEAENFAAVWDAAQTYFSFEHPDRDAEGYISFVFREAVLRSPSPDRDPRPIQRLREVLQAPLASLIGLPAADIKRWVASVEWLRQERTLLRAAGMPDSWAKTLSDEAVILAQHQGSQVAALTDSIRRAQLYELLYGLDLEAAIAEAAPEARQVGIAREAASRMSHVLMLEFQEGTRQQDFRRIEKAALLTLYHGDFSERTRPVAKELEEPFRAVAEMPKDQIGASLHWLLDNIAGLLGGEKPTR